jgi:hypothetical protein
MLLRDFEREPIEASFAHRLFDPGMLERRARSLHAARARRN